MRVRDINRGEVLFRFQDLRGQLVCFTQGELRVDQQHVFFAGNHGGVDVVPVDAMSGVDGQLKF